MKKDPQLSPSSPRVKLEAEFSGRAQVTISPVLFDGRDRGEDGMVSSADAVLMAAFAEVSSPFSVGG